MTKYKHIEAEAEQSFLPVYIKEQLLPANLQTEVLQLPIFKPIQQTP